jgi:polysaccharide biosynthesis/export protein
MSPAMADFKSSFVAACALSVLAAGCATMADPFVWVDELPQDALVAQPYAIRGNDQLQVTVFKQESLSGEVLVRSDGQITLPLIGDVPVVGLTPPKAAEEIARRLASTGYIDKPSVSVAVVETRPPAFAVLGEVSQPGNFQLLPGTTVLDGLALAGGLSEFANHQRVFVIRRNGPDGKPQRVRFDYDRLSRLDGKAIVFTMADGDVIVVE